LAFLLGEFAAQGDTDHEPLGPVRKIVQVNDGNLEPSMW